MRNRHGRLNRGRSDHIDRSRIAVLDFRGGAYNVGGDSVLPAAIFGAAVNDAYTGTYDPSKIVAGSGLIASATALGFIGALATIMQDGATVVFDFTMGTDRTGHIEIYSSSSGTLATPGRGLSAFAPGSAFKGANAYYTPDGWNTSVSSITQNACVTGFNRAAGTFSNQGMICSLNGARASQRFEARGPAMTPLITVEVDPVGAIVHQITIYRPTVSDRVLQQLSRL